ncbi:MAG: HNH endonuclease [Acidimicrobiia bacterium]
MSAVQALVAAVEALPTDLDEGDLVAALGAADRLRTRLAVAVSGFEADGRFGDAGAVSMVGWLAHQAGFDRSSARRLRGQGRKLARLPEVACAATEGRLAGGQVEVILGGVPDRHLDRFAAHEAELVPLLARLDTDATRVAMAQWRAQADACAQGPGPVEHDDQVFLASTFEGRGELRGSLSADLAAVLDAALRVADPKDFGLPLACRRAAALGQVCQFFLDHQQVRPGARHRPHLNVVVDAESLDTGQGARYLDTGQPVSPAAFKALCCDAGFHRVLTGRSGILDYGRATRSWPTDLYNAVVLRDQGCRIGGCDAPASWCDVHHVMPWEQGGPTSLDNAVMTCRAHHQLVHRAGHHLTLHADARVTLTLANGRTLASAPRGPSPTLALPTRPRPAPPVQRRPDPPGPAPGRAPRESTETGPPDRPTTTEPAAPPRTGPPDRPTTTEPAAPPRTDPAPRPARAHADSLPGSARRPGVGDLDGLSGPPSLPGLSGLSDLRDLPGLADFGGLGDRRPPPTDGPHLPDGPHRIPKPASPHAGARWRPTATKERTTAEPPPRSAEPVGVLAEPGIAVGRTPSDDRCTPDVLETDRCTV